MFHIAALYFLLPTSDVTRGLRFHTPQNPRNAAPLPTPPQGRMKSGIRYCYRRITPQIIAKLKFYFNYTHCILKEELIPRTFQLNQTTTEQGETMGTERLCADAFSKSLIFD